MAGLSTGSSTIVGSAQITNNSIINEDINSAAAIAVSKLAALGTAKVVQTNATTGILEASAVTNTSLSYLDATSSVQTQINTKAPIASPTFTGTVGGITKAMVGLTNVDDTSDATKNAASVTLTNKALSDSTTSIVDVTDATKKILFDAGGTTVTTTTITAAQTANRVVTLPDATDTLVGKATTDVLTNKSIDADTNTITNIEDADIKAAAAIAYSKLNLTGAILSADLAGSIDATKIADGSVTSTEFQYINTLSSNAQTQLDAKQLRSVLTTKGDLYVATASDTVARQAVGADDKVLTASSSQTNGVDYHNPLAADFIQNVSLAAAVGSNALTISLKTAAGSDASATDPVKIAFRSATLTSGVISLVKVTAALSTVISSGSTAGHTSGQDGNLYIGAMNNAGTVELCWSTRPFDENALISTTAEGGAGAADSATVIYSTTARSNLAVRFIGKMISNQTTAGTYAAVPTNISTGSGPKVLAYLPPTVQVLTSGTTYTLPTSPRKPLWIQVKMVGAGGGGGGGGTASQTAGGAGGNTTFGTSLLTANGGSGGREGNTAAAQPAGGAGGSFTVNSPAIDQGSIAGGGGGSGQNVIVAQYAGGGYGGQNTRAGAGIGNFTGTGTAGAAYSGAGGGGGGTVTGPSQSGGGGGAGGYVDAIIPNPSATYPFSIPSVGTAGGAGASGAAGSVGASVSIIVTEFYQ